LVLEKLAAEARSAGVQVETQLLSGPAAEVIAATAQPTTWTSCGGEPRPHLVTSILLGGHLAPADAHLQEAGDDRALTPAVGPAYRLVSDTSTESVSPPPPT